LLVCGVLLFVDSDLVDSGCWSSVRRLDFEFEFAGF